MQTKPPDGDADFGTVHLMVMLLLLAVVLFGASGCGRDARAVAAQQHTGKLLLNYSANHGALHRIEQDAYERAERAHINGLHRLSIDGATRIMEAGQATPAQYAAEIKRLENVRAGALASVQRNVQAMRHAQVEIEKDFVAIVQIQSGIARYDDLPEPINIDRVEQLLRPLIGNNSIPSPMPAGESPAGDHQPPEPVETENDGTERIPGE